MHTNKLHPANLSKIGRHWLMIIKKICKILENWKNYSSNDSLPIGIHVPPGENREQFEAEVAKRLKEAEKERIRIHNVRWQQQRGERIIVYFTGLIILPLGLFSTKDVIIEYVRHLANWGGPAIAGAILFLFTSVRL
jgi:hypothetical protein